jgi:ectoine hydroxylase-related dioxygenase (phytanoyl-CoA dioxygenase family)
MKSLQIVAHTAGGEVRGAVEQVTERDYETLKSSIMNLINGAVVEFNTDNGWVVIPTSQIFYVEVQVF